MAITTYTPSAAAALGPAFVGQPFDDPKAYTTPANKRIDAKYFLYPIQNEILRLIGLTPLFLYPEVDLKTPATFTLAFVSGKINIDEVGIRLTTLGGTITTQPTIEWGITGSNAKYYAASLTTLLTAVGKRERFQNLLADDAENSVTFTITVGAAGSAAINGTPYVKGVLI